MTTIRLTPKQTTVREGWQWTGQPREEWPAWVQNVSRLNNFCFFILYHHSGNVVVVSTDWLVLTAEADGVTDVTPYTDDELWKEFER